MDYKSTLNLPSTNFPMKGDGPKREPEIQKFWFENNIYEKALEKRKVKNKGSFLLHDGPPYLSSPDIHIGTALNKILKDIVVKYKTLQGYYSPYLPGFDCHGLPIESAVLKDKKSNSLKEISPLEIRKQCTEFVIKNKKFQEEKFKRLGILGDWDNAYMTIHPKFEAKQLKLFSQMVEKGYIYRGLKPVYWCSTCQTALAEAEVEYVENYKSPSIYVSFEVVKSSCPRLEKYKDLKVIIWTTTPWTIPGNLAIAVNESFEYVVVYSKKFGHMLIASGLLSEFNKKISEETTVLEKLKGKELEKSICQHPLYAKEIPVILGEHVTLETGTGCVHTAPGHGFEDFAIGFKYGLGILSPVDSKGLFTEEACNDLKGLYVHKAGNQKVIELLLQKNALISQEEYFHSYPHCWRSKTPIIFRATKQWFCSVEKFKDKALKEIDKVQWIPPVGRNRIYSMVESRTDWCISRQRVWGVPIPAVYCNTCKENNEHLNKQIIEHVAKIVEENGKNGERGTNAWWELDIKELLPPTYKCDKCGNDSFTKETDTMDVWFDSGSTHFAVIDERKELKDIKDVMYLEGSDQHRGWFQSSLLTSVAIKEKAPYKYVLTHGFVLDENGRKMSKSLGNVIDPQKVINEYGADILRLWVSSTDYSSDMRIGQTMLKQLAEVYRNIRNTARFILSNLYDFDNKNIVQYEELWFIDKFILSSLEELKKSINSCFNDYQFYKYYQLIQNFCTTDLSSFYFDIVKDRLYTAGKNSKSRKSVQFVLNEILNFLVRVLCPVLPHLAQDIWDYLPANFSKSTESPICLEWIESNPKFESESKTSEKILTDVRAIVNKALEIARAEKKIGKSLEAKVHIYLKKDDYYAFFRAFNKTELEALFIVSQAEIYNKDKTYKQDGFEEYSSVDDGSCLVVVTGADGSKCPRCWKYSTDIGSDADYKDICILCVQAVNEYKALLL
ncbi:MAG: isoleucine--tRNA ligase [Candidatus Melainabacteria bacterium]|nr:isoleucine--tRNA ligase [Candidatus Melainabacteria bacterium]